MNWQAGFVAFCVFLTIGGSEALFLSVPESTCKSDEDCKLHKCVHHEDYALCNLGSKWICIYLMSNRCGA